MINMKWELVTTSNNKSLKEQEQQDALVLAMENIWIDEEYIAKNLKSIIDNAVTETKKWDIIEDFATKLSALKTRHKFRKDTPDVQIQIANIFQTWENIL